MYTAESQLAILLEFGKVINKTKTLDAVLESMADFTRTLLNADRCSIFMFDPKTEELYSKFAHNIEPIRVGTKRGIAAYAALSQDTQIIVDAYHDFRFNPDVDKATGYLTQTVLAVPLVDTHGLTVGVFQVLNKHETIFTNVDAEILLLISNYAAAAIENAILYDKIRLTETKIIHKLASVAEFKDQETSKHTKRVGLYSALLGKAYGMHETEVHKLELTAPMHDAGKIGIPDTIMFKTSKLNFEEFEYMKTHTSIGYDLLLDEDDDYLKTAALIALEHHERWDGTGYPNGKKGENISIYGRIVAIADVFDALLSERPYKQAWHFEEALAYIKQERGSHFDPVLIDLFFENLDTIKSIYWELKD